MDNPGCRKPKQRKQKAKRKATVELRNLLFYSSNRTIMTVPKLFFSDFIVSRHSIEQGFQRAPSNQQLVGLHSSEWCNAFIYLVIQQSFRCSRSNKRAVFISENEALGLVQAEVEETLKRIQSHKGVIGTMVVNAEGIPIRTTLDNSTTVQYAGLLHQLTMKAKSTVRDIDPQNDLTFLRIRSKKHEIMVAPDKEYLLIVIQNPCE
ncbi:hypothetical protein E5288_WYG003113 [Bos mutus]|uniref:Roadblock/LAMTOR2 domain-containing protein n=3 Tax=Boreoeutheria TaxID=1437010 RepID=A0A6B0R7Y0_9CETA|nr:hypothetical protein [Bos mutus]